MSLQCRYDIKITLSIQQLVGCRLGGASLMAANAWPAGGKLGLARVRDFRLSGRTQPLGAGTDRDSPSGRGLA